jgi:hypothetical protein
VTVFTVLGQNWDIILFALLVIVHIASWWEYRTRPAMESDRDIRQFGATTMSSTATAGITAVSILIPASLLVIQLGRDPDQTLPPAALDQVFRGVVWLLISMAIGLFLIYLLPMRAQKYNVGKDFLIGSLFAPQLLALFIGIIRIVLGLQATIYG